MESGRYNQSGQRRNNNNNYGNDADIGGRNMDGKDMKGVKKISELTSFLDLTSAYGARRDNVVARGVTLLVNATEECPKQEIPGVESIKIPLGDNAAATINRYFDYIADKINEHASRGGRAMVHCVRGRSRSATLCLAYLMKYHQMSLNTALQFVSARRPIIKPNSGFRRQLKEYEVKLNGGRSAPSSNDSSAFSAQKQQYQGQQYSTGGFDYEAQSANFGYSNYGYGRQSPAYDNNYSFNNNNNNNNASYSDFYYGANDYQSASAGYYDSSNSNFYGSYGGY